MEGWERVTTFPINGFQRKKVTSPERHINPWSEPKHWKSENEQGCKGKFNFYEHPKCFVVVGHGIMFNTLDLEKYCSS
jgi:hypothetical protein